MKKTILSLAFILLATASYADSRANPNDALDAKQAAIENKLEAKQNAELAKIDAKIAKAKATGRSTERLENRRAEVIKRISAKEDELQRRTEARKARHQRH